MLRTLKIKNFAIIDQVEINFGEGLNILTGETGAGKSIIMDALLLILGGRASSDLIRQGQEEAVVEALFELPKKSQAVITLQDLGIPVDDGEVIVRRHVFSSGKGGRIYLNGTLANASVLQSVTSSLVDLCSQFDQQLLSKPEEQLLWLDRFGDLEPRRESIRGLFLELREKRAALDALLQNSSNRAQRLDFVSFQAQEIQETQIQSEDEDTSLEQELKLLNHSESLFTYSAELASAMEGEDRDSISILSLCNQMIHKTKSLLAIDGSLSSVAEHLNEIKIHAEEVLFFVRNYSQGISRDEGRLEEANVRINSLTKLKKKYGPTLREVLSTLERLEKELFELQNHETSLKGYEDSLKAATTKYQKEAAALSKERLRLADLFSKEVLFELKDLNMERARFQVDHVSAEEPGIYGTDQMRFQISVNPGEPLGFLNKVASGGELSRVMLAIHNVVSSRGGVGVFLFDEVDTGIGGNAAVKVGMKLQKVAHNNQVVCITHLPQVAAFGDHHLRVEKTVTGSKGSERTICKVIPLDQNERDMELARMLGGMGNDKAALINARAMLEQAKKSKQSNVKAGERKPAPKVDKSAPIKQKSARPN